MPLGIYDRKLKIVSCPKCGRSHEAQRAGSRCHECRIKGHRAKAAKFRAEYPERAKAVVAAWRVSNPDKVKAHKRKFQENKRAHRCAYERNRFATKLQRTPAWADLDEIQGMYDLCSIFRSVGIDLHVDHIVPLKGKLVSGLHVAGNLQLLHAIENMKKKNRLIV